MASVPDHTKADMTLLADTAANGSPSFPFHVCHRNGYFALDPAVEYDPTPAGVEIIITAPANWSEANGAAPNAAYPTIIGAVEDRFLLLTPVGFIHAAGGWANGSTDVNSSPINYVEGKHYKLVYSIPDKDTITLDVYGLEGGAVVGSTTLVVIDLFAGNPVITFGYPTKAQLTTGIDGYPATDQLRGPRPAEGMVVHSVSRESAGGPTAITISSLELRLTHAKAHDTLATFFTEHPTQLNGFQYAFATGTGDAGNGFFAIVGDELRGIGANLNSGYLDIRVRSTDNFGKYTEETYHVHLS